MASTPKPVRKIRKKVEATARKNITKHGGRKIGKDRYDMTEGVKREKKGKT